MSASDRGTRPGAVAIGVASSLTADNIQDWGVPGTYTSCIKPSNLGGAASPAYATTPGVVSNPITGGTEFLVATLTFHVGTIGSGTATEVQWMAPVWTSPPAIKYQVSYPDGVADTGNASFALVNGKVTFPVPEPATMLLAAVGAAAVIRRRRR